MNKLLIYFIVFIFCYSAKGQSQLPYKNASLPVEVRVRDLLSRMTAEEKFRQLFMIAHDVDFDSVKYVNGIFGLELSAGKQNNAGAEQMIKNNSSLAADEMRNNINAIQKFLVEQSRLGIPAIFFGEALHGVVAKGATAFPQSIALAATFDTALVHEVASAIALETQERGLRQILSPVINLASDVRWGRVEETYGEDPFLSSEMAVAFVVPFEKKNIVTTPKHFVANVGDGGRDSYPIHSDERTLNQNDFAPFRAAFTRGGARSVMSSYNSLNGEACSMNNYLLNKKLKQEWKFNGFVISDAGAVGGANVLHNTSKDYPTSGKLAIENGLDVIFQTSINHDTLFNKYFLDGSMDKAILDSAVSRVLRIKFELGLFEQSYALPVKVDYNKHVQLAKQAAVESIVLLKNDNATLPLNKKIKSIAVIGADAMECRLGGYSGEGNMKVNLLDGIKNEIGKTAEINFAEGVGRNQNLFACIDKKYLKTSDGESGIHAEYFGNINFSGAPLFQRNESQLNFHYTFYSPNEKISADFFCAKFTTKLTAPKTGNYKIGLEGNDGYRMYIDNKLVIDKWSKISYHQQVIDFNFTAGKSYDIKIEFYEPAGNSQLKLIWNVESQDDANIKMAQAIEVAKKSDVIIVVAGIDEGEFLDRDKLHLPDKQEEQISRLSSLGKPVVVLLVGGSAITMDAWLDSVDAVMDIWYGGEQSGNAVAAILFGDQNPSGKLPITFPMREGQLPLVYNHEPTGRGDDYINSTGLPLFPFGYGLSYTTFEYSNMEIQKPVLTKNDSTTVTFTLKNTGKYDGAEVVQLYLNQPVSKLTRPVLELKGFKKVFLKAGQATQVTIPITGEMFKQFNNQNEEIVEAAKYKIMIGASSRDLKLKGVIVVE